MNSYRKLTFDINEELYKKLKKYCFDNEVKIKEFINNAINEYLK